jgi:predicted Ser/Thr protein kinase
MSLAEKQALALRDLAVIVAKAKGVIIAPDLYTYHDAHIRIEYNNGKPQALDLFKWEASIPKFCL